jgi:hypothetical protein
MERKSKLKRFGNVILFVIITPIIIPFVLPYLFVKHIIKISTGK